MKYVIFLGDGMADDPREELGGRTPLEAAAIPNINRLAREGVCGLLRTVPDGLPPDSTVANLSVMGYDPRECLEGRGVLEAAAMGVEIGPSDHAMRLNLITVTDGKIISHSAENISSEEAAVLIAALREGLRYDGVECHAGVSYRHVLKLTRPASKAIDCFAPHDHLDELMDKYRPRANSADGEATAELLNELITRSAEILENHPVNLERARKGLLKANYCWPWSIGRRPKMKSFQEMFGVRGSVVAAVDLIRGIGRLVGMTAPVIKGATGIWNTNYEGKADAALRLLENHDLVYIHVEAPDEAGHEGNLKLKVQTIEDFDRRLVSHVVDALRGKARFAVLPDHYTPVALRTHVGKPVPFAIMGPGLAPDDVQTYSEAACARGRYPDFQGADFMRRLITD
ncbi:MAG: cofactor-independent phosphoglycerate mutase [Candidatus Sumerlaeota bacterium]|nr:cofactor-independent phosphoglycerate mutase [Candidatus Sumerlaeota bacterium]